MSVQVIMKDGLPEWAVIPYADYEALLQAAGKAKAPAPEPSLQVSPVGGGRFSLQKLAELKAAKGLSTEALARDAGISPAYCALIESGEREPSPATVRGFAQALKVPADQLLT